jgi:hypothetical protein
LGRQNSGSASKHKMIFCCTVHYTSLKAVSSHFSRRNLGKNVKNQKELRNFLFLNNNLDEYSGK